MAATDRVEEDVFAMDDETLRKLLEDPVAWGGSAKAAQVVRTWPTDGPPGNVRMTRADVSTIPPAFFAYCRDRVFVVDFGYNPELVAIPSAVERLTELKQWYAHRTGITVVPEAFMACQQLRVFDVSVTSVVSLPNDLALLPQLHTLRVHTCKLTADSLCIMAEAVRRSKTLLVVGAADNQGSDGYDVSLAFARALRSNGTLVDLSLLAQYQFGEEWNAEPPFVNHDGDPIPPDLTLEIDNALLRNRRGVAPPEPYAPLVKAARN